MALNLDWPTWLDQQYHFSAKPPLEDRTCFASLVQALGLQSPNAKVVVVAGTNGKGSMVYLLEYALSSLGFKVGVYTSPHLFKVNERIRINQHPVSDQTLGKCFKAISEAISLERCSFFEVMTLMALKIFSAEQLDFILLEVGLGGRLDPVNAIDADLSIITTIDYDHMDVLGYTLDAIAAEKAGILRPHRPAVYCSKTFIQGLWQAAQAKQCPWFALGQAFDWEIRKGSYHWFTSTQNIVLPIPSLHPDLVAGALQVLSILDLLAFDKKAWSCLTVLGRLTQYDKPIATILDVAHNPQSVAWLKAQLPLHQYNRAIIGVFKDKDLAAMLKMMQPVIQKWYIAPLQHPRAMSLAAMMKCCKAVGIEHVSYHPTIPIAYQAAVAQANLGDLLVAFGSFRVVAALVPLIAPLQTAASQTALPFLF